MLKRIILSFLLLPNLLIVNGQNNGNLHARIDSMIVDTTKSLCQVWLTIENKGETTDTLCFYKFVKDRINVISSIRKVNMIEGVSVDITKESNDSINVFLYDPRAEYGKFFSGATDTMNWEKSFIYTKLNEYYFNQGATARFYFKLDFDFEKIDFMNIDFYQIRKAGRQVIRHHFVLPFDGCDMIRYW